MKLTTEQKKELMKKWISLIGVTDRLETSNWWLSQIEQLEIELPGDEEIEDKAYELAPIVKIPETEDDVNAGCREDFVECMKWMLEQINSKPHTYLDQLRSDFYAELTEQGKKFNVKPHEVFNWFVKRLEL